MERERVIARYLRVRFFLDMLVLIVLTISIQISSFGINYVKILIILNFRRIYEIDKFYVRALSLHRKSKTAYVLFKQMVIIYVLSHIQGVIFYWIDFSLLSSEMCQNNPSRTLIFIQCAGSTQQEPTRLLLNCPGVCNISISFIGVSAPLRLSVMETSMRLTQSNLFMKSSCSAQILQFMPT